MTHSHRSARTDLTPYTLEATENTHSSRALGLTAVSVAAVALLLRQSRRNHTGSTALHSGAPQDLLKLTVGLLERLLPSNRRFEVRLWDGTLLPGSSREASLVLNHPDSLGRMLKLPLDVTMGEAYLRGDWDIEGDYSAFLEVLESFDGRMDLTGLLSLVRDAAILKRSSTPSPTSRSRLRGGTHTRARDRAAIAHHYDVSNAFYKLWLDPRMQYSCAYFPTGTETLAQAQDAKLELICRKLRLKPGERLLDIGCGWGGLSIYAAQQYGVQVTGVTLSKRQLEEGKARVRAAGLERQVRLELLDYRDVQGKFDKISSVGMSEHVGRRNMSAYFRSAFNSLEPGGLMLNHAISDNPKPMKVPKQVLSGDFSERYIFPDGELLPIGETLEHAESVGFEVRDVESLREHYARTLELWAANLERESSAALKEVGLEKLRLWRLYLHTCAYYFRRGYITIHQTVLAKPDAVGLVHLPRSRADLYR